MNHTAELIAKTKHLLPDLNQLEDYLANEADMIIVRAFPQSEPALRARGVGRNELELGGFNKLDSAVELERRRIIKAAQRAVNKIRKEGEKAKLEPEETYGYEAIISMIGRPAILIQNGCFFPPPVGWEILENVRDSIERTSRSVGRIELSGHPRLDWIGTGFLVAEDIVMTNRHVAKAFCHWGRNGRWEFELGLEPRIDYVEELGTLEPFEFAITEVIDIHDRFDLALLKVSCESLQGREPPEPLVLASEIPGEIVGRKVYVLGYPAWDPHRNDPEVMRRIFANIYGVKRLQPGKITENFFQDSLFYHDCSTLGGNSGSCVVDLETNLVIGLHFAGRYMEVNKAVSLWTLRTDPLFRRTDVHFN